MHGLFYLRSYSRATVIVKLAHLRELCHLCLYMSMSDPPFGISHLTSLVSLTNHLITHTTAFEARRHSSHTFMTVSPSGESYPLLDDRFKIINNKRPVSTIGSVSDYDGTSQLSGGCGFEPRAGQLFSRYPPTASSIFFFSFCPLSPQE